MIKAYGSKKLERDFGPVTFGRTLWVYRKGEEITQKDFARSLGYLSKPFATLKKGGVYRLLVWPPRLPGRGASLKGFGFNWCFRILYGKRGLIMW